MLDVVENEISEIIFSKIRQAFPYLTNSTIYVFKSFQYKCNIVSDLKYLNKMNTVEFCR